MAQPAVKKPSAPKIGEYEIISKIGKGGIAEVYKALQISLQRKVAPIPTGTMPKKNRVLYYPPAAAILLGIPPALVWDSRFK